MFINRRKRRAVPHRVASQGNATYYEPGLKGDGYQVESISRAITKELAYLLSRLCTVDATTMRVHVLNGQVVPPFAEGATLP